MRGKHLIAGILLDRIRITPADAGKTLPTIIIEIVKSGSPPRMRGKPSVREVIKFASRITPADAGKTVVYNFK